MTAQQQEHPPNPVWPLPGHVLTTPGTGPGAERWEEFGLDQHDW